MKRQVLQLSIGLAAAIGFLLLALDRAPLAAVGTILAHADPLWLFAALASYAAALALRAKRWQVILRPVAAVPYAKVARVLLVGYGFNTIMPARLGELFRAEFFKEAYGLPRVPVLTSIVVERLFDGLAVVGCLALGLVLAGGAGRAESILVDVVIAGAALFGGMLAAALGFARLPLSRWFARLPRVAARLTEIERGLSLLHSRRGVAVALLTVIVYVPDALTLWFVVKGCGYGLGFADTLVLLGGAALSTLLPSGPAFLGTLQFAYVLAIEFAGGQAALGVAAATLTQFCLLLPVAVLATALFVQGSGGALYAKFMGERISTASPGPNARLRYSDRNG
jgi:uncharacterized protein (TIRG00374 family)